MFESAIDVLKLIEKNGFNAYIVGGYVRDIYMSLNASDIDIATSATPKDLINIFKKNIVIDEKYGSTKLTYKNYCFDITTFRKDIKYNDNRRPSEIEYVDTIEEDLKRRDFTINTMCMDKNGEIIDVYNAKKDINSKVIKTVRDANTVIKEDALRILRAIRFATTLNFRIDKDLDLAIKKYAKKVKELSYSRKKEELNHIFRSDNYEYGIKLITKYELDKYLEIGNLKGIKKTSDVLGMWAQIEYSDNYPFSKLEKETIQKIKELLLYNKIDNYSLYKYGNIISITAAEVLGVDKKDVIKMNDKLWIHSRREIKINNLDIALLLGIKIIGNNIKDIFNDIEYKILSKELKNNRYDIKKYILKNYGGKHEK